MYKTRVCVLGTPSHLVSFFSLSHVFPDLCLIALNRAPILAVRGEPTLSRPNLLPFPVARTVLPKFSDFASRHKDC